MKKRMFFLIVGLSSFSAYIYLCEFQKPSDVIKVEEKKSLKMRKFLQNKLWRDNAADRLEKEDGAIIHRIILDDEQYNKQLGLKLEEEAHEVATAVTRDELVSEIGDVLDVLDCIIRLHNCTQDEIDIARQQKRNERGGSYFNREFVTVSECLPGSFLEDYLLKQPDKYIEIFD